MPAAGLIGKIFLQRTFLHLGYVITVTCPSTSSSAGVRADWFIFALAGQLLTKMTFTY